MNLAPVILFVYNRLHTARAAIESLQNSPLAAHTRLVIYSDGSRGDIDAVQVQRVRKYIHSIRGFASVQIVESEENKGLAASIIRGVGECLQTYGSVIVIEDDLLVSNNFLAFMNSALTFYQKDPQVLSIAGYTAPVKNSSRDVYFTLRASSWGWATWRDRWIGIDWQADDIYTFLKNRKATREFNRMGSDLTQMLKQYHRGRINSWAIRWVYHQFKNQLYTVYPTISKVRNIGIGPDATHTKEIFDRFHTPLDRSGRQEFSFEAEVGLDPTMLRDFLRPFSLQTRLKYKVMNLVAKAGSPILPITTGNKNY